MVDLHASVREWEEESKLAKLPRVRCPKGHFISWKLYDPLSMVDRDGNPAHPEGTFCCKVCGRYYDARACKEERSHE